MTEEQRNKLCKIYELVKRGATEGEQEAAKAALDRFLDKHNLDESVLNGIDRKEYIFKYGTNLENWLLKQIMYVMVEGSIANSKIRHWRKEVVSSLIYVDWITIECAFEYFRRHMKSQWRKVVEPELKRCRTTRTRNKKRNELNPIFFSNYIIASKLYKDGDVHEIDLTTVSKSEIQKRRLLAGVEGGEYSRQVTNGLLLSN